MDKRNNAFIVYNHKVARYLARKNYYWTTFRQDNFDKTKYVFVYENDIEEIKALVEEYKKIKSN